MCLIIMAKHGIKWHIFASNCDKFATDLRKIRMQEYSAKLRKLEPNYQGNFLEIKN